MLDVNGQSIGDGTLELVKFAETASAVNEITVTNSATGNAPEIASSGDDTNIDLKLTPKGTGKLNLDGIKFPNADGTAGQALVTNGSGVLSFATAGIAWQTIVTGATLSAVAGRGYWIDTTSNACTVTLPASATNGDTIILADYARKWGTNAVTINQNSLNFQGSTSPNPVYNTNRQSITLIYSGATQGWIPTVDDDVTYETPQPYSIDFLVIAGGGGGGTRVGGGAGAGGYRNSYSTETSGGGGSSEASLSLSPGAVYTITVGAGGAGAAAGVGDVGIIGSNSSISGTGISTITSTGGGRGAGFSGETNGNGGTGGSGGGGAYSTGTAGSGTANQGYNGGAYSAGVCGAGGGGAGAVGNNSASGQAGNGGAGLASSITGSSVTRAGGGGGGGGTTASAGTGGTGGGGNGAGNGSSPGAAGTENTGGGGGSGGDTGSTSGGGGAGGSGVVILRMPTANYSGTTTGSPTVTTDSSDTILVYNASGTYTG
jgi:hypothetical protein